MVALANAFAGQTHSPLSEMADTPGLSPRVRAICKTAGMDLNDSDAWRQLAAGFTASIANVGVFDKVLADAINVPLHSSFGVITADATGSSVAPGRAKPVSEIASIRGSLDARKASALVVLTESLARFANADLIVTSMRTSVAAAADKIFLDELIASTTPIAGGSTILANIRSLLDAVSTGSNSKLHMVLGPVRAKHLATAPTTSGDLVFASLGVGGGTIGDIQVHVSDHMGNAVLLIDASAIAANAQPVELKRSSNAAFELSTTPSGESHDGASPPDSTAVQLVSMFQTYSLALMAERFFGFTLLRSNGVASLSNISW
jgi:hypothetical protein